MTKSREKVQLLKYLTNLPVVRNQYRHPYIPDKQNLYTQSYLARVPNLVFYRFKAEFKNSVIYCMCSAGTVLIELSLTKFNFYY